LPVLWHLVIIKRVGHSIKFFGHDDLSDKGKLHVLEHFLHEDEKLVVSDEFLSQHSVHGLIVIGWVS